MPTQPVDLSIIIVTWNVWTLLQACLHSLENLSRATPTLTQRHFGPRTTPLTLEVIVVDNAGSDETPTALPTLFPWVRFIRSETNRGFTGGNNLGYGASHGAYIFFLNPDTELLPAGATSAQDASQTTVDPLWQLYQILAQDKVIGMAGPQLRYGDGSWQNSRRHFPTPLTGFWESTWLGQSWPENPWARHMHMRDVPANAQHEVDWLNGSAMFCRRSALETVRQPNVSGPFDEGFFMYSEELDLCQRLKGAGWRIVYIPQALVIHYEGRSSSQVVARRHIIFNSSKLYYYRKYFGRGWAKLLRHYLLLEYRLQLLIETAKLLLGHQPTLRRARIQAYRQVLQSGFQG